MNPNLVWDEMKAKMADARREAEHRHMEGEAHRACQVCGATNHVHATTCSACGGNLPRFDPSKKIAGPEGDS
jgi:ribosomal protein L37E